MLQHPYTQIGSWMMITVERIVEINKIISPFKKHSPQDFASRRSSRLAINVA